MQRKKEDILLCLLLFRSERSDSDRNAFPEILQLIGSGPDWESLLEKSAAEFVSPIVYYRMNELGIKGKIPADVLSKLEKFYEINRGRNLKILGEAKRVLGRFKESGIDFICLKGLALAETVYQHFALRQMSDVDLLVRKDAVLKIDELMAGLGYEAVDAEPERALLNPVGYLSSLEYRKRDSQGFLAFHIHWHPVNTTAPATVFTGRIDLDRIWREAIPARIADVPSRILSPAHQIIFLCEHALRAGHSFDRLVLIWDIHRVIGHYGKDLNWEEVVSETRLFRLSHLVYAGLSVVRHYTPEAVPEATMEKLKPESVSVWEKSFLFLQRRNMRIRGLGLLVYLGMHRGVLSKANFLFRILFPPASVIAHKGYGRTGKTRAGRYASRSWEVASHLLSVLAHPLKNR